MTASAATATADDVQFEYLPPPRELDGRHAETTKERIIRKSKENPFVPLGAAVTTFALTYGIAQMRTGRPQRSQMLMRLRVAAQGFTIFAVLAGVMYGGYKSKDSSSLPSEVNVSSTPKA